MALVLNLLELIWVLGVSMATCMVWTHLLIKLKCGYKRYGGLRHMYDAVATMDDKTEPTPGPYQPKSDAFDDEIFQPVPSAVV